MNTKIKYIVLLVILSMLGAPLVGALAASGTPDVGEGYYPFTDFKAGVKLQNFNNSSGAYEAILGSYGFPTGSPKIEFSGNWIKNPSLNHITFSYNPITGLLRTTILAGTSYVSEIFVGDLGVLNYIKIEVANRAKGTTVEFNSMKVDGINIQNFTGVPNNTKIWSVRELSFTDGFTIEGDIALSRNQAGQDTNMVEITVGHYDVLGPISSMISVLPEPVFLNGQGIVGALVDDSTTYGSDIASADFFLDGAWFSSMAANDGYFDEVAEDVNAGFTGSPVGTHSACVRGTDNFLYPNVGDPVCQDFVVDYMFYGFDAPLDTYMLNLAKGGQAIPVLWRLTDALGVPIDNSASFVALKSFPISCGELTEPAEAVEESATGDSGLQYLGDGYWQFNWKTLKSFAGTCRAMYVEFDSGTTSPIVFFQFK